MDRVEGLRSWGRVGRSPRVGAAFAVALAVVGIGFAFLLKFPCVKERPNDLGYQYRTNCYSDILALYGPRRPVFNPPDRAIPFSQHGVAYRDNNFEYPALTGLYVSSAATLAPRGAKGEYFGANAAGLAIAGIAGAAALGLVAADRKRLALLALAPAMISYGFHGWDLLPLGFLAGGMAAFTKRKDGLAGVLLGLGAAAKIFPGFAIPAMLLARRKSKQSMRSLLIGSTLGFLVPNLIVLANAGKSAWWFPWKFQGERGPNFETAWYLVARHARGSQAQENLYGFGVDYAAFVTKASMALFVLGAAVILLLEARRREARPFATTACVTIWFLVTAKVFSPQFMIWLLPFFVAVRIPWHAFVLYAFTDMFALGSIWALGVALIDKTPTSSYFVVLEFAVWMRYAALLYLLVWTARSPDCLKSSDRTELIGAPA